MKSIVVIDYGIGNILSVVRAFEHHNVHVKVTDSPSDIVNARSLVLPGVGAFGDGMQGLREKRLIEPILEYCLKERPFLGICLGMQMMMDSSEEFNYNAGLGIISGTVKKIQGSGSDGTPHKIPHIGWNELIPPHDTLWDRTILDGLAPGTAMYFVHSFTPVPNDPDNRLSDCSYDGLVISAVIRKGNLYGCQFHPEKSGKAGLHLIKNFIAISFKQGGL